MKSLAIIVVDLLIGLALWIAFTCHSSLWEWAIGAAAAIIAVIASFSSGHVAEARFQPQPWMLAEGWRIPWYVLLGTCELFIAVYRQIFTSAGADSNLAAFPFAYGAPKNSRDSARRMLAVFYTTLTPNSIVLGPVRELNLLLYHQALEVNLLQMTQHLSRKSP